MQGTTGTTVNEDDPGVPGAVEAHDRFGYSLAAPPVPRRRCTGRVHQ
ncbi:hypothetical protein [Streptomyces olivaceiscleroticus]